MQLFNVPERIYYMPGAVQYLAKMPDIHRVLVVSDRENVKFIERLNYYLEKNEEVPVVDVFYDVNHCADTDTVSRGVGAMRSFRPDTVIALGGGNVMDSAKAMAVLYANPDATLESIADEYNGETYEKKVKIVCVPTTSGSGAEITSTAVICDSETGKKYHLTECGIKPDVAITDCGFVYSSTDEAAAKNGLEVLARGIEAYTSLLYNDYTDGLALHAIKMVFKYLPRSCKNGSEDRLAREKMHNAAAIAGMAYESTLCGVNSALSHSVSAEMGVSKGLSAGILLPYTIAYNSENSASEEAWPKYGKKAACERYREIAEFLGLPSSAAEEGVKSLIDAVKELIAEIGAPASFKAAGAEEAVYLNRLPAMAARAAEDRDIATNPRIPTEEELKAILKSAL
jgi:acetaldehyde dehydrogenase/alcohol dehydrogenase